MWENKTQKIRAQAEAKKKERNYSRLHIHFKRIAASIELLSPEGAENKELPAIEARTILNDLNHTGVGLYSPEALNPGQKILLSFDNPTVFKILAIVKWCQSHNANTHIITTQPFSYRMGVEFVTQSEAEVQSIQDFCSEMSKAYLNPPKS